LDWPFFLPDPTKANADCEEAWAAHLSIEAQTHRHGTFANMTLIATHASFWITGYGLRSQSEPDFS
jgi:hypothetical protein